MKENKAHELGAQTVPKLAAETGLHEKIDVDAVAKRSHHLDTERRLDLRKYLGDFFVMAGYYITLVVKQQLA